MSYQPQRSSAPTAVWVAIAVLVMIVVLLGATVLGLVEWNGPGGSDDAGGATGAPGADSTTTTVAPTTTAPTTTTRPPTWEDVAVEVGPAVVRVESASCTGRGTGSGFLVSSDLVVTAAHVVEDSALIAVMGDDQATPGRVIGFDRGKDVALVRVTRPFDVQPLTFSSEAGGVGEEIAAIGYPRGQPRATTFGHVVALDESTYVGTVEQVLSGLVRHDATTHPGNSGGPIVSRDGEVQGLTVAGGGNTPGLNYAVPSDDARALVEAWRRSPAVVPLATCEDGIDEANTVVSIRHPHPDAVGIAATLQRWVDGINYGEYEAGWAQYSPKHQRSLPFDSFQQGFRTSVLLSPEIWRIEEVAPDLRSVELTFFSYQDAAAGVDGQTCTFWRNRYEFRSIAGDWKIDGGTRIEDPGAC